MHVDLSICQDVAEVESLIEGDDWPYDSGDGAVAWTGPGVQSFWIILDGERAGVVRLYDLDDGAPMFDLRLLAAYRGRVVRCGDSGGPSLQIASCERIFDDAETTASDHYGLLADLRPPP